MFERIMHERIYINDLFCLTELLIVSHSADTTFHGFDLDHEDLVKTLEDDSLLSFE